MAVAIVLMRGVFSTALTVRVARTVKAQSKFGAQNGSLAIS